MTATHDRGTGASVFALAAVRPKQVDIDGQTMTLVSNPIRTSDGAVKAWITTWTTHSPHIDFVRRAQACIDAIDSTGQSSPIDTGGVDAGLALLAGPFNALLDRLNLLAAQATKSKPNRPLALADIEYAAIDFIVTAPA